MTGDAGFLAPPAGWPELLRSTLGLCLDSPFPIAIYGGPELALLYNDAWRPILGDKHPWALGRMLGPWRICSRGPRTRPLAEDRDALETVRRSGQRLLRLVNALLDFARIEAGRAGVVRAHGSRRAHRRPREQLFRSACERAELRLVVDCPPAGEADVDRERWEKIVLNLLSDAFTAEAGFDHHLVKPADLEALQTLLATLPAPT